MDWFAGWGGRPRPLADPLVGLYFGEKVGVLAELSGYGPLSAPASADYETDQPVFLTWGLHGSLPYHRPFPAATVNSGQASAAMDRLLSGSNNDASGGWMKPVLGRFT